MWILLWIVLSSFVLIFFGWSLQILLLQKKAWRSFAKKTNLRYSSRSMMGPPSIEGVVDGIKINMYTGMQPTADVRGQRFLTVIEFEICKGMPTGAAIGTASMKGFIDGLVFKDSFEPKHPDWKPDFILRTRNEAALREYLTGERMRVLTNIFSMKGSSALFLFDELESVLRVETSDPLKEEQKIEKMVRRFIASCKALALSEHEKKHWSAVKAQQQMPPAQTAISVAPQEQDAAVLEILPDPDAPPADLPDAEKGE
jgi:hypothetical protein